MKITPDIIDHVKDVLCDKNPKYRFSMESIPGTNEITMILYYKDYTDPSSFGNSFKGKIDKTIFHIKEQILSNKIEYDYVRLLLNELSETLDTFKLYKLRDKKFQYQPEAVIPVWEGYEYEGNIEKVKDEIFDKIVEVSQLKYDYTVELINGLKEMLDNDNEPKKQKLNIDDFFDLLSDHVPTFQEALDEIEDVHGTIKAINSYLSYKDFKNAESYHNFMVSNARKIIREIRTEFSKQEIGIEYINAQLHFLNDISLDFVQKDINDTEYLCHINSRIISEFGILNKQNVLIEQYDLKSPDNELIIKEFVAYNKSRHEVITSMIEELEEIISNNSNKDESTVGKLELNVPLSDIALLFRLLEENKVFSAKHRTHIHRVLKNSFKSPDKSSFNEGSIKNAYNDPDPNSVQNLKILLSNMKGSLNKF